VPLRAQVPEQEQVPPPRGLAREQRPEPEPQQVWPQEPERPEPGRAWRQRGRRRQGPEWAWLPVLEQRPEPEPQRAFLGPQRAFLGLQRARQAQVLRARGPVQQRVWAQQQLAFARGPPERLGPLALPPQRKPTEIHSGAALNAERRFGDANVLQQTSDPSSRDRGRANQCGRERLIHGRVARCEASFLRIPKPIQWSTQDSALDAPRLTKRSAESRSRLASHNGERLCAGAAREVHDVDNLAVGGFVVGLEKDHLLARGTQAFTQLFRQHFGGNGLCVH